MFQRFVVFSVCLNFSRVGTDKISVSSDLNFLSEGLCKVPTSQDRSISRPGTVFPPIRILWKHWSWGLNPGPSWWEAKGWPTGPLRLCVNAVKLQALTGLPPAADYVGCEAGRRTCSKCETGTKSCVRSSGIIILSARRPSDSSGRSSPQTRPQWKITSGSPM